MNRLMLLLSVFLIGCSSKNTVNMVVAENAVIKHSHIQGYEDRYSNLYDKQIAYPVTCEENCYPTTEQIQCQEAMENCHFVGNNPSLELDTGFTIQWLGHAYFKINTADGQQFLFDPVFEQFDWPVNWAFYLADSFNRQPATPLSEAELKQTTAVMYSHIHYDHFNKDDIAALGTKPQYLVPLGFAKHFAQGGYNITEMAWYSSKRFAGVTAHFVPANHFSSRIWVPFIYEDNNASLWGGWILEQQGKTLFFAGDTGYSPHFKDIQAKYGDIDICLLPIASYYSEESPKWYRKVHTTPEDALTAAQDLNCKVMIPWGYGNASWKMGDRSSHSALFRLLHMRETLNTTTPLYILNEGEAVAL
ncbi:MULTISPECIES: MBL fold metallo-hydrolase [unclassified Pseudoalteromonas]|uniref:MBL fold metallo-hydrolase n=1 Tax=unclassified Pseudoalteromonas TaxID=194690 RepID=UPI003014545C